MKHNYTLLIAFVSIFSFDVSAQTFTDNFDSYTAGSFLTKSSTSWKTWSGTSGGTDDVKVSNAKSKSGSNSIYFGSTASPGGPTDIVLPFGGQYNSGSMNFSAWIFIESNKKAYLNMQEQTTLGKGWTVDMNFDSLGNFNLINTTGGNLLSGKYTQNEWMNIEFQIDLNTNTWNFFINSALKGSFQNTYRQIASLNIYPTTNCSFYIDDVSFTYTPYAKPNLNATVTYIGNVAGSLANQKVIPTVEIRNVGTTIINSVSIELNYEGVIQTKSINSGLNLASMATTTVNLFDPIVLKSNQSVISAKILSVNGITDDNVNDNIKTINLNSPTPAKGKVVVAEEATGTWCQWCPRGAVWLEKMSSKYDNLFIGIAVHNRDPMTNSIYDAGIGTKISGYPSLLVDRGASMDPSAMEDDFLTQIMIAPKAIMHTGAKYNSSTNQLDVSITTKFNSAVTGNYKIAFVLVEDSVTGTTSGYNQSNAYAGGGSGVMGGYELLGNPVPASKMVYDHVGRIISPGFAGQPNAFSNSVNINDSFTHNFSVTLDPSWKTKKMHLVGLFIDPNGKIDNGHSVSLEEAIQHGFVSGSQVLKKQTLSLNTNTIEVYPNPSNHGFNIVIPNGYRSNSNLSIFNAQGLLVERLNSEGQSNLFLDASAWQSGIYYGIISDGHTQSHIKFIKN